MPLLILDLCGGTGAWSRPYADAGYDVVNVTLPLDVRDYKQAAGDTVHGILAAPPCTEFAVSGARWWKDKPAYLLAEALEIVDACLDIIGSCRPKWWALENPIGRLRRLRPDRLGDPALIFNPCDYGDPWTKKTLLWGKYTQPERTPVLPSEGSKIHRYPPGPERAKLRSITPPGFARAFFEANP